MSDRRKAHHGGTEGAEKKKGIEMLIYGELTHAIRGAAMEVHKELGPGLLESANEECMCHELSIRGLASQRQVALPVVYKGIKLDCGYRLDLVVEHKVILELKSVQEITPLHEAQLLTYLRLSGKNVGLLMNFNTALLKHGIKRLGF